MISVPKREHLLVFQENLELVQDSLKANVIRMAGSAEEPHNPLRSGKEVRYDPTGQYVLPDSWVGISLAGTVTQLFKVFRPKRTNYFVLVDRNQALPRGFEFNKESEDHWMLVVTEKMTVAEYQKQLKNIIQSWVLLGEFVRYE